MMGGIGKDTAKTLKKRRPEVHKAVKVAAKRREDATKL